MPLVVKLNGTERVLNVLQQLQQKRGAPLTQRRVLEGIGDVVVRSIVRGIRNQVAPDGTAYKAPHRYGEGGKRLMDTNRLLRSISRDVIGDRVLVGSNVEYAAMQHYGGVQRPKRAKALAIPLTRQVARAVAAAGGWRAAYPDAFVFRSLSQGAFLVRRRPDAVADAENFQAGTRPAQARRKGGPTARRALEFLGILKKSQRIEGTHFLGLSKQGEADVFAYLERVVHRIVEEPQQ
jgi:phage virion morphogenesis protein